MLTRSGFAFYAKRLCLSGRFRLLTGSLQCMHGNAGKHAEPSL